MTNHEMSSPHILTLDYLMHQAPCLISPSRGVLRLGLGSVEFLAEAARHRSVSHVLHGGAFVCVVRLDGVPFRCNTLRVGVVAPPWLVARERFIFYLWIRGGSVNFVCWTRG